MQTKSDTTPNPIQIKMFDVDAADALCVGSAVGVALGRLYDGEHDGSCVGSSGADALGALDVRVGRDEGYCATTAPAKTNVKSIRKIFILCQLSEAL